MYKTIAKFLNILKIIRKILNLFTINHIKADRILKIKLLVSPLSIKLKIVKLHNTSKITVDPLSIHDIKLKEFHNISKIILEPHDLLSMLKMSSW